MSTLVLPPSLLADSIPSGNELGWRKEKFLAVLNGAATEGFACLGGQFQWVLPDGTCEAYWLNADSSPRETAEPWRAYVKRTEVEVSNTFESLLRTTDFNAEAERFEFLKEKKATGIAVDQYLLFVAYFVAADDA